MAKIKLDLHDIFNRGSSIDAELNRVIQEAVDKGVSLVEIIPGKGSGQLKKHVLRFLEQKHIKALYHRIEKDDKLRTLRNAVLHGPLHSRSLPPPHTPRSLPETQRKTGTKAGGQSER